MLSQVTGFPLPGYRLQRYDKNKRCTSFQASLGRYTFYFYRIDCLYAYIIPIPAPPAGIAGVSSLMEATTDSVVSKVEATLVAF